MAAIEFEEPRGETGTGDRGNATTETEIAATDWKEPSVSVFARGSTNARRREESVLATLRSLQGEGQISGLEVHTWPSEVSLSTGTHADVLDTYAEFEAWAADHDASLEPPFLIRDRRSAITHEADTLLLTPLVCLAVYESDDVAGVFPCTHGGSVTTIDDCLERLADHEHGSSGDPERGSGRTVTSRRTEERET